MKNKLIHVLDSIPGTRKTSGAIDYINNNPTKPILYICEYTSEIDRVCNSTHCVQPESVYDDKLEKYYSKKDDIKKLLVKGVSIASSHALFINFDSEILSVIEKLGYEIILDEVVDVIGELKSKYNDADHKTLSDSGLIKTDSKTGKIIWDWEIESDSAYDELRSLCETGQLYKAGVRNMFIHIIPIELFSAASKVTVMTYNFKGSHLYQYFIINGFNVVGEKEIKAMDDTKLRQHIKDHIVICRHKGTDKLRTREKNRLKTNGYTLSYSCYYKAITTNRNKDSREEFKKFISSRLNVIYRAIIEKYNPELKVTDVMYTFPMDYSGVVSVEKERKGKVFKERDYIFDRHKTIPAPRISSVKCFVPLNCRGTNEYADKAILIHCHNQYVNPCIKSYYETFTKVRIDEDQFALNTLVQWIFRSRIRKYIPGQKIYVYCLSERMENILRDWLDSL